MRTLLALSMSAFTFCAHALTLPAGATLKANVAYGSDPLQKMDVYIPKAAKHAAIVLMVHGGGWQRGDKTANDVITNKIPYFLGRGYVFISMNYRLFPKVNVPDEASDVKTAVAYVQKNASKLGGDPSKIVLMGHSAGGNLVTLAQSKSVIGVVVLDSDAYDVLAVMSEPHQPNYDQVFDHDQTLQIQSSPTLELADKPVPMLLVCDSRREGSCPQANMYAARAKSFGATLPIYQVALRHGEINLDVGLNNDLTKRIQSFLCGIKAGC